MNNYLFSFTALLLLLLLADRSSCNRTAPGNIKSLVPLAVGNFWVYADSTFTEGRLAAVSNDTDKIVSTGEWNGKTTFVFNDGREWYAGGDTIYQLSRQRTGTKFPSPVMMATETAATFNYVFGGDVVMQKTIEKLQVCPEVKWQSAVCYKITDHCEGYQVVAAGIGMVREKITACFMQKGSYSTRTLIDLHLQ